MAKSFSDEQLLHLKVALGSRKWGKHKIDFRGTFIVPFVSNKFYYVLLLGKNNRDLTRSEKTISALTMSLFFSVFVIFSTLLGLFALYLIKSALGIDIIDGFSFGAWTWLKVAFN